MKYWAITVGLSCAVLAGLGCDRKKAGRDRPAVFDADVDPHASVLVARPNPDLLADQTAISRRIERTRPVPAPAVEVLAPAGEGMETDELFAPAEGAAAPPATEVEEADKPRKPSLLRRIVMPLDGLTGP